MRLYALGLNRNKVVKKREFECDTLSYDTIESIRTACKDMLSYSRFRIVDEHDNIVCSCREWNAPKLIPMYEVIDEFTEDDDIPCGFYPQDAKTVKFGDEIYTAIEDRSLLLGEVDYLHTRRGMNIFKAYRDGKTYNHFSTEDGE